MLVGVPLTTTLARTQAGPRPVPQPVLLAAASSDAASEPSAEPIPPALNPLADSGLGAPEVVRARPLFARSRRPPDVGPPPVVEASAEPPAAPPSTLDLYLVGIVEGIDTLAAVLKRPNGDRVTLHLGETVDAWAVAAIGPHSLTLRQGDHELAYMMFATRG